jgi:hypothetical protein
MRIRIGVAISGGGYRASAWGLGALEAIHDVEELARPPVPATEKLVSDGTSPRPSTEPPGGTLLEAATTARHRLPEVTEVASVSGGSITNAWLGLGDDEARRAELARGIAGRPGAFPAGLVTIAVALQLSWVLVPVVGNGWARVAITAVVTCVAGVAVGSRAGDPVFGGPVPWLYLAVLGLGVVGLAWSWFLPWSAGWRLLAFVCGLLLVSAAAAQRGMAIDLALRRVLRADGRTATMADLTPDVQRVICSAEMHAGHNLYLLRDVAYTYDLGVGRAPDLPVSTAVQCSANLPGAFPIRWLRAGRFSFTGGEVGQCAPEGATPPRPGFLALSDGGVYDNMADQWHLGHAGRLRRLSPEVADRWRAVHADILVVANASGAMAWQPRKRATLPLVGEVTGLMMVKDVLYDQTTSSRRRELVHRFDSWLRHCDEEPGALAGTLVHILTSPWSVPFAFDREPWPDDLRQRARAAKAALEALGIPHRQWTRIACDNAAVGTQLWPLGPDVTARLRHHAYVQTAVNLHVLHGVPLPTPLPTVDRFRPDKAGGAR